MKCFLFHYIFLLLFIFNCCLVFIKLVISDGGQRRREILNLRVQKERKTRSKSIEKWNHLAEQEVTLDMAPRAEWVILTAWCEGQFQGAPTPISTSPSANNPRGEEDGCKGQPWGRLRAGGAHELTPEWKDNIPQTTSPGFTDSHPPHPSWAKSPYAQVDSWENVSLFQINLTNMIWAPTMWAMYKFLYKVPEELNIILNVLTSCFVCFFAQWCLTLRNPMDWSLPGFPVHGIFQARILEWVAISFSRGSSTPRDGIWVSCIVDRLFPIWATAFVFHLFVNNILPNLRIIRGLDP